MTHIKTTALNDVTPTTNAAAFAIRAERASDVGAREALLDVCFGASRFARTCERLREGRAPAEGLAFTAVRHSHIVGTVRLWHVSIADRAALVLGPLAVDPTCQSLGIGGALMRHAVTAATMRGHGAIVLLGDAPYYEQFGFSAAKAAALALPGAFERERLLGLELRVGTLDGISGVIVPTGARTRRPKRRVMDTDRREVSNAA
jgi:predicted N-acetyltransferase YhbS